MLIDLLIVMAVVGILTVMACLFYSRICQGSWWSDAMVKLIGVA